jgi:hypothetical protein
MPADVTFNLRDHVNYVRSFTSLRDRLGAREAEAVIEVEVLLPDETAVNLFMECRSLYFIGFRGGGGRVIALAGDGQDFAAFLRKKVGSTPVVQSIMNAKYDVDTWGLKLIKSELHLAAAALNGYEEGRGARALVKGWIDRLAFAVAESARFIPIRCAVACELCDDHRFKQVLHKLAEWSRKFRVGERSVEKSGPGKTLSKDDQRYRDRLGEGSIHLFQMRQNVLFKLTNMEKWLLLLSGADLSKLTEEDRKRLKSLEGSVYTVFSLADYQDLVKNWQKLSSIDDPNLRGLLDAVHVQHTASSGMTVAEWH